MAKVKLVRQWPDGDVLAISIKVDTSYPDSVAEAKRTALDAYAEALADTLAGNTIDEAGE